ncbi:MAG TPA: ATP-binding protein [Thermomicrobiales bacterium]|nr:ATP-binding protein [Thermomicrobiales bacterium]
MQSAFADMPDTARNHFRLNVYVALYDLVYYLRHLGPTSGDNLRQMLERYPFLKRYFEAMFAYMPDDLSWDATREWWEVELKEWEAAADAHLPLVALAKHAGLSFESRIAAVMVGLVEEDSRFGTLFSDIQRPLSERRPGLELIGQAVQERTSGSGLHAWSICRPLVEAGIVEAINRDAPRSEWVLRVPPLIWDAIRGEASATPAPWLRTIDDSDFPRISELIFPDSFVAQLRQLPALIENGRVTAVVVRGMQGSDRLQVLGAVARAMGHGVAYVDLTAAQPQSAEPHWPYLGPFCAAARLLPVIGYDLGPGETVELPALTGYSGPVGVLMGTEGGLSGAALERAVTLTTPVAGYDERRRYWQATLPDVPAAELEEITRRFQVPGGYIRQMGPIATTQAALQQHETVQVEDVREASRSLNRQLLDSLAARLDAGGTWDSLVVSTATERKLHELEQRCRYRERLLDQLGPGFATTGNRGVRALFSGPSGTGKTLATRILASVIGMDLYRVDLGAVVNKYIGETEKNLHRVLSRAEELDVILLLDEGDALLGTRTEVKSANDRYANLETNYLLQRLEQYQGIVIVTTNAGQYIDNAFQRRMDIVVNFVPPQAQERRAIWDLHLPNETALPDADLAEIAARCALTGGQIRNAALHATLLAAASGDGEVTRWQVEEAIQSEYRKAGALSPLTDNGRDDEQHGGLDSFLKSLGVETA